LALAGAAVDAAGAVAGGCVRGAAPAPGGGRLVAGGAVRAVPDAAEGAAAAGPALAGLTGLAAGDEGGEVDGAGAEGGAGLPTGAGVAGVASGGGACTDALSPVCTHAAVSSASGASSNGTKPIRGLGMFNVSADAHALQVYRRPRCGASRGPDTL